MTVIALLGNKGGAGKTTVAINLATTLHQQGNTLRLLDADPQGSVLHWAAMVESDAVPPIVDATEDSGEVIREHRGQAEYLIVDCPPQLYSPQTQSALAHCDIAVIPVLPSPLDLWATVAVDEAITQARSSNPELQGIVVVNQLEPRTKLSRLIREALPELSIPAAETALRRRAIYRASVLEGKSVSQMGKKGEAATEEINQLITEVLKNVRNR